MSCGGVALAVASPYSVRLLKTPSLDVCRRKGGLLVSCVVRNHVSVIIIIVYGFARSHPEHNANETLLCDTAVFAGGLSLPCVIMGDMNASQANLRVLAVPSLYNLWRLTGDEPTTRGRESWATRAPLDHILANAPFGDFSPSASILSDRTISNHFPTLLRWYHHQPQQQVWHWPRTSKAKLAIAEHVPWNASPQTYPEWCRAAQSWLKESCQATIPDKTAVVSTVCEYKHVPTSKPYLRLLAVQRALAHIIKAESPTSLQLDSLRRKLAVIQLDYSHDWLVLMTAIEKRIAEHMEIEQDGD